MWPAESQPAHGARSSGIQSTCGVDSRGFGLFAAVAFRLVSPRLFLTTRSQRNVRGRGKAWLPLLRLSLERSKQAFRFGSRQVSSHTRYTPFPLAAAAAAYVCSAWIKA